MLRLAFHEANAEGLCAVKQNGFPKTKKKITKGMTGLGALALGMERSRQVAGLLGKSEHHTRR